MTYRQAREAAGLSVIDAARELGTTRQAIYMWEWGKAAPSAAKLLKLSVLYRVPVEELLNMRGEHDETL